MQLTALCKEEFDQVYQIIEQSFPQSERRTHKDAFALISNSKYHIYVARNENGAIDGFIAAWNLDDFYFVEHFAVSQAIRGGGLGSKMMKTYLKQCAPLPVYLEVEEAHTEIAKRRIRFYERLGFVLTQFGYTQPRLQHVEQNVFLNIMSYPYDLTQADFTTARNQIFRHAYGIC